MTPEPLPLAPPPGAPLPGPSLSGLLGLVLASGGWWRITPLAALPPGAPVLIHDPADLPAELRPWITAGCDPQAILDEAFEAALGQGFVILRAPPEGRSRPARTFRIAQFAAPPGAPGRQGRP